MLRDARPVFDHQIATVWDNLGPKVPDYLDSVGVLWTSIDVVRFRVADSREVPGPVVLWIGVKPQSLSGEDARVAAIGCQGLLKEFEITDVDVEFRESIFTRSAGPKLLKHHDVYFGDATIGFRGPLTPALGLPIAARATPYTEGTGGIYISEGGDSKRVFILTARHVVFPRNAVPNELYSHTIVRQPHRHVLLLGNEAFQTFLKSIMIRIGRHALSIDYVNKELERLTKREAGKDHDDAAKARKDRTEIERQLQKAKKAIESLDKFHDEATKYWSEESQRILGHIAHSPPFAVGTGTKRFAEDWALIELDSEKIDWKAFRGNVIDLGTF